MIKGYPDDFHNSKNDDLRCDHCYEPVTVTIEFNDGGCWVCKACIKKALELLEKENANN